MPEPLVAIAAFFQRAFQREFGVEAPKPGEKLHARSARYLGQLDAPQESLRFKITPHNLSNEYDLLDEEAVTNEAALLLQLRIVELAAVNKATQKLAVQMLNEGPVSKLFAAILSQAERDGASAARIQFPSDQEDAILVHYRHGDKWLEAMTIPETLSAPLRGSAIRAEHATYDTLSPFMQLFDTMPNSVEFAWVSESVFEATLGDSAHNQRRT